MSSAVNIITRPLQPTSAAGFYSRKRFVNGEPVPLKKPQVMFAAPWNRYSLIGTIHEPYEGEPGNFNITEQTIRDIISEVNEACPAASLKREDVYGWHAGLLPMAGVDGKTGAVNLLKQYQIRDHVQEDNVEGLVSVLGVKYTTARQVMAEAVDLVFKKLRKKPSPCRTAETPVFGGEIENFDEFVSSVEGKKLHGFDQEVLRHLVYTHGSNYMQVVKYIDADPSLGQRVHSGSPVLKAEVLYGVREEMARKLADVVLRRTELGAARNPSDECLAVCARIMGPELGWDEEQINREIMEVKDICLPKV